MKTKVIIGRCKHKSAVREEIKAVLVYLPYAKIAFWCLVRICQNGNFHGYFYESMVR